MILDKIKICFEVLFPIKWVIINEDYLKQYLQYKGASRLIKTKNIF